jgi:hypothetical protein
LEGGEEGLFGQISSLKELFKELLISEIFFSSSLDRN